MRFATVAVAASTLAVASAQWVYPFTPNGPCVLECDTTIGNTMMTGYTEDPANPKFMESLALTFERGSATTVDFMTKTGMCFGKCPTDELTLYTNQYTPQLAWYVANKGTTMPTKATTTTAAQTTTTTSAATTSASGTTTSGASSTTVSGSSSSTVPSASGNSTAGTSSTSAPAIVPTNQGSSAGSLTVSGLVSIAAVVVAAALF